MANEDNSQFGKRFGRYTKVSGTMAGLAARMASEKYLGLKINRDRHADDLMQALGNIKGPIMKVGQILATIPEALPTEYAEAFQQLQSNAPSMGESFVKRRMKAELGINWLDHFEEFDLSAAAAASLGQVHKARLEDGRQIACKLQYPDMSSAIDADLKQLKTIMSLYEKYDSSISTQYIHEELSARLREELDYELEAKHCKLFAYMLKNEKAVHVPEVIDQVSTGRLLSATWLDGSKILTYKDAPIEQRNTIALNLFKAWYTPLYEYGAIHGDPHLGNYSIRENLDINLLDFGCIRFFRPEFINGVIELYYALLHDDLDRAVAAYESWGFKNLSTELIEILNVWAGFLYSPLMDDKVRTIGETNNGVYGRETAGKVHTLLKEKAGGIAIPREFVFMDRAALGLGSVFIHLKAEVNWYKLFNEMIEGFDVATVRARQEDTFPKFGLFPETIKQAA